MRSVSATLLIVAVGVTGRAEGPEGGEPMSGVVPGNNRFAIDLHARLRVQPGNLFVSLSSIATALAMTFAGARGETAEQMAQTLHFSLPPDQIHPAFAALIKALDAGGPTRGSRLRMANRLWGARGDHYLPAFLAITRDRYGAELAEVDFAATEQARLRINAWVAEQTESKIGDLIPPGVLDPTTRLVLTNAVYLKGDWSEPFPKTATQEAPFHIAAGQTVPAPLMHRQDDFRYWAGDGLKALELPYGQGDLSMVVLLPDASDGLPALEARLTETNLGRWLSGLQSQRVQVHLPRFKMTARFALGVVLKAMEMPLGFDPDRADFSGMTRLEPLFIAAVIHQAFVDVNEEGTEAAAATAVVMAPRAMRVPPRSVVFQADHPFLFLIRDNRSGSLLFVGWVKNPQG